MAKAKLKRKSPAKKKNAQRSQTGKVNAFIRKYGTATERESIAGGGDSA